MKMNTRNMVLAALFLALALFLPFLTGQIPQIGSMISPMHIPVLLCGFICGWPLGALVGLVAPLLRSAIFASPPMYPVAIAMAFELMAYGFLAGLLYRLLPKTALNVYVSLVISMLGGRIVFGLAKWALLGGAYAFEVYLSEAFGVAVPAIVLHIAIIPPIILALKRAKLIPEG